MTKNIRGKIIACLDIGSSKLVCLIASINNDDIRILGYSHKESRGISMGAISDMKLAQKSITNAVSEAERMAGINIQRLIVSISGSQVSSNRLEEGIKISSKTVRTSDIASLASKIREQYRKNHREMIHLIPMQYRIDDSSPINNPRYMSGEKLYSKFHAISTSQTTINNIESCLKRCQLSVNNYIVEPFASSLSCLNENEMNVGTLLIDFGGDVTSFCLLFEGKLIYVGNVPIAGNHITRDIATILGVNNIIAEKVKNLNGSLFISPIEEKEIIKFRLIDHEAQSMVKLTRGELCEVMTCRIEEILESVKKTLAKSAVPDFLINNIVITGGVSSIVGVDKIACDIFDKNVKIGYPSQIDNLPTEIENPSFSCALGMLVFSRNLLNKEKIKNGFEAKNTGFIRSLIEKLANL